MSVLSPAAVRTLAGLTATTVAVIGGAAVATPADAADFARGRVTADGGLTARAWPTTRSESYGTFPRGKVLSLQCKIRGSSVDGNDLWYLVPAEGYEWVSARYVANVGAAPGYCSGGPDAVTARTTTALTKRAAPTTAAAAVGTVPAHTAISVVCKLDGQDVGGNARWYYTQDGRWLSAYYLTNVGPAPFYCG